MRKRNSWKTISNTLGYICGMEGTCGLMTMSQACSLLLCSHIEYVRPACLQQTICVSSIFLSLRFSSSSLPSIRAVTSVIDSSVLSAVTWTNWTFTWCFLENSNGVLIKGHERNINSFFFAPWSLKFTYTTLNLLHTASRYKDESVEKFLFIHGIIRNT